MATEQPQVRLWKVLNRRGAPAPLRPIPDPPRRILLATAAMPIDDKLIRRTIELATPEHAKITVLGVAKVYGTVLGFPNPGLQPTRLEIAELKSIIKEAASKLRKQGFEVRETMSKSRNAAKMIGRWVNAKNFHAVVVADVERPNWRKLLEGDIVKDINHYCPAVVHAVAMPSRSDRRARPA